MVLRLTSHNPHTVKRPWRGEEMEMGIERRTDTGADTALAALAAEVDQLTAEVVALAEEVDRVLADEDGEVNKGVTGDAGGGVP